MHAGSGAYLQSVATPLALLPLGEGMIFGRVLEGTSSMVSWLGPSN